MEYKRTNTDGFGIFLLVLLFLGGCMQGKQKELIRQAAEIVKQYPDSAYYMLNKVDPTGFESEEEKAAYILLCAEALYQGGEVMICDSLLKRAREYYYRQGDELKVAEADFFMGRAYSLSDCGHEAVRCLVDAEQTALKVQADFLLARVYNELGDLHLQQYIIKEALGHYRKAYYYARNSLDSIRENYAIGNMAKCFLYTDQADSAWCYYLEAINRARGRKDRKYEVSLEEYFSEFYLCQDELPFLKKLSEENDFLYFIEPDKACGSSFTKGHFAGDIYNTTDTFRLRKIHAGEGQKKETTGRGEIYFCDWKQKRLADSLSPLDKRNYISQIEEKYRNEQLMSRNYLLELNNYHKKVTLVVLLLIIVVLIFLASLIVNYHRKMVRKSREALQEYIALVEALKEKQKTSENDLLRKLNEKNEKEFQLKIALEKRLDIVKQLTDLSFRYGDNEKTNQVFCRKVKKLMDINVLTQSTLADLLEVIDLNYQGIVRFLRDNYGLSEEELVLCCFLSAGFTPQEMSVLYNVSVNSIYLRCSRLGKKMGLSVPLSSFIRTTIQNLKAGGKTRKEETMEEEEI